MDARPMPPIVPGADVVDQGKFCEAGNYCSKDLIGMKECGVGLYQPNLGAS
jgi:hypothetical protein